MRGCCAGHLSKVASEYELSGSLDLVQTQLTGCTTGLSRTYCGMIRRGVRVPHPRHWEALRDLVSAPGS
jgi:hypothetical protein